MSEMDIRVIQWNISSRCNSKSVSEYINEILKDYTIVNLQEVTRNVYSEICSMLRPFGSAFSLDLREPGNHEGKNRSLGVATLSFGIDINHFELLNRSVFPERTLFSKLRLNDRQLCVLNFHSLTGVDYKKAKSSNFASIADFMEQHDNVLDFACFDANEPKMDSMDEQKLQFFDNRDKGRCASLILGENKVHSLNDSFVRFLKMKHERIQTNPLAVSYITGKEKRRYDYILCSKKWQPIHVEYPYTNSINASSDHSIVIGDFVA